MRLWMSALLLMIPVLVVPAFAETQTLPTEDGTLDIKLTYDAIEPGDQTRIGIDFINPVTQKIQVHIDYNVTVSKGIEKVFGPTPLIHTSEGSVKIPIEFNQGEGEYIMDIQVKGILFQPIPAETASFVIVAGSVPDTTQSNTTQSNTTQSNTTQSNTTQSNTTQSNTDIRPVPPDPADGTNTTQSNTDIRPVPPDPADGTNTTQSNITDPDPPPPNGGCLIATAAYGSELAPQVQQLREIRDNTVLSTKSGAAFMAGFNQVYYSFSPAIADLEREHPVFREMVRIALTPMLASLSLLNHADIDSEGEMLGYGVSIVILNLGMYVGSPIFGAMILYRNRQKRSKNSSQVFMSHSI